MTEGSVMATAIVAGLAVSWAGLSGMANLAASRAYGRPPPAVEKATYRGPDRALAVEFADGRRVVYVGVPHEVYRSFLRAPSMRAFFEDRIRGHYGVRAAGAEAAERGIGVGDLPGRAAPWAESPCGPDDEWR